MSTSDPFKKYFHEAISLPARANMPEGVIEWQCPANIALVKYWGKSVNQIPKNPSVSLTMKVSVTKLILEYRNILENEQPEIEFYFNSDKKPDFQYRFDKFIELVIPIFPFINRMRLRINSFNNFPHAAGIASSASGFGALAIALTDLDYIIRERNIDEEFFKKASCIARLGSGSASRSVYGGYALWGKTLDVPRSSDFCATPVNDSIHNVFRDFCDTILIISREPKKVSSSSGHFQMQNNPYSRVRYHEAKRNTIELLKILESGDLESFVLLIEKEALSLHAMMMTGTPGYILMKPQTVSVIENVWRYREKTNQPVCFTLDAGANVHLLYPKSIEKDIKLFVAKDLLQFCEKELIIHDSVGEGPVKLR